MADKLCKKCKYDLVGLKPIGNCPECGTTYNFFTGEGLYSFADITGRSDRILARIRTLALVGLTLLVATAFTIVGLMRGQQAAWWLGGFFTFIIGLGALYSYVSEKN